MCCLRGEESMYQRHWRYKVGVVRKAGCVGGNVPEDNTDGFPGA